MPTLPNYNAFAGRHWETGSIANALAYQGVKAPHNTQPLTEALLLGVSGGITVGYFTFAYAGHDPHIALLTRNTFDPMTTILDRLAIVRDVRQTDKADKGEANLLAVLEEGSAPLVWADSFSLPYNNFPWDDRAWGMMPLIVFGIEGDTVSIADCASTPLHIDRATLAAARARVKADRLRVMELDAPDLSRLPEAVTAGINDCIALFTEAPPRGKKDNFGLAALAHWADMLTNTRNKQSWTRQFARGSALYQALLGMPWQPGVLQWVCMWGADDGAERALYASFLEEAALILSKPALREAAAGFLASHDAWNDLANALVPADGILREAHGLLLKRHALRRDAGDDGLEQMRAIDQRLAAIRAEAASDFPMSEAEVAGLQADLAARVLAIRALEADAVQKLKGAMQA